MSEQARIETAIDTTIDNCEVLRARLAKYEDADGKPITTIAEQVREIERQTMNCLNLRQQLEDLKAQPSGVVLPEWLQSYEALGDPEKCSYQDDPRSPAELSLAGCNCVRFGEGNPHWPCKLHTPVSACGVDERAALATLERFVETVRECYHLASSYSGCLDNVDEHGGDYHEDPICAVFHRLYYAMFDGDKALDQARAALSANHSERVRHMVPTWNLAADELPASGKTVLAFYLNSHGMGRRIRATHVKRFTVEAEEFADPDTQCCEYSEQDDCYYTTEGWYELIDNWPDYSSCAVIEGVITHWMPLPTAPSTDSQKEQGE